VLPVKNDTTDSVLFGLISYF